MRYSRAKMAQACAAVTAVTLTGAGCARSVDKVSGWEHLSPGDMLREAGRICADADTFEAIGEAYLPTAADGTDPPAVPIRWVFGREGEFRMECGSALTVFDGRYRYASDRGAANYRLLDMHAVARRYNRPLRYDPHHRLNGDLAYYASLLPTAAARQFGTDWVTSAYHADRWLFEFAADEAVSGHPCRTIVAHDRDAPQTATFWIDADLGVIRKWQTEWTGEGRNDQQWTRYDTIRLNPRLVAAEFGISEDVLVTAPPEKPVRE